jgi:hypothetical protein
MQVPHPASQNFSPLYPMQAEHNKSLVNYYCSVTSVVDNDAEGMDALFTYDVSAASES